MKILDFLKANSANNMEGARKRQRKKPKAKIHKRKGGEKTVVDPMLDRIGRTYVDWLRRQVVTKRDTAEKMHGQKKSIIRLTPCPWEVCRFLLGLSGYSLPDDEQTVDISFKDPKELEHLLGANWNNQTIYWQGKPDGA
jgi:hypothetical protein